MINGVADLQTARLDEILQRLGIAHWDLLIFSDGSGVGWKLGCGWAAVLIDRRNLCKQPDGRKLVYGSMSTGTVAIAELMPTLHALLWHRAAIEKQSRILTVHVVSDSQSTVNQGNDPAQRKMLAWLWRGIEEIERSAGYKITWHWLDRDSTGLNALCDHISRLARETLTGLSQSESFPDVDIAHLNPS